MGSGHGEDAKVLHQPLWNHPTAPHDGCTTRSATYPLCPSPRTSPPPRRADSPLNEKSFIFRDVQGLGDWRSLGWGLGFSPSNPL